MPDLATPLAATAAALLALLLSEAAGSHPGCYLSKPAASCGFLWAAQAAGAAGTAYGRAVLVGLALSWLGDVLLLGRSQLPFTLGLGSFLVAHLAYTAAFLGSGCSWWVAAGVLAALAPCARGVVRWVWPGVPRELRGPVLAYVAAISAMVACAAGAAAQSLARPAMAFAGAVLFYLSDVCVAAERFCNGGLASKLVGLPLYYLAQCLLACSVAAAG